MCWRNQILHAKEWNRSHAEDTEPTPTERSEWKTIYLKPRGTHKEKSSEHHLGNGLWLKSKKKNKNK